MPPNPRAERYLALFVAEAGEHLAALGRELVALERSPAAEHIDAMFRHAHSVKGMAAAMGFDEPARLAHRLEDLLGAIRSDVTGFDRSSGDLVLQAVDALLAHVQAAAEGRPFADASVLAAALDARRLALGARSVAPSSPDEASRARAPAAPSASPPGAETPVGEEAASARSGDTAAARSASASAPAPVPGAQRSSEALESLPPGRREDSSDADAPKAPSSPAPARFLLRLRVAASSIQPGVRGFLAFKRLSSVGTVLRTSPSIEAIKAGRFPDGIELELETLQGESEVARVAQTVSEVELLEIAKASAPSRGERGAAAATEPAPAPADQARTVRIKTELLDHLLDTAGELLLATARVRAVGKGLPEVFRPPLDEEVDRLQALIRRLHDRVMLSRMTPVSVITDALPRAARDLARRMGKEVELSVSGADIELDRSIVDELSDPLLHLLRNAIGHGVESAEERRAAGKPPRGRLTVEVRRSRDRVLLEVADDGRGIEVQRIRATAAARGLVREEAARSLSDREALMLVCLPGFTTVTTATDISGRGVGLDAVKRVAESVGGTLEIETRPGQGTRFRISVPLTVAMVNLLLVGVGEEVYGLPIAKVAGVVETPRRTLTRSEREPVLPFGASVVPVYELAHVLRVPGAPAHPSLPSPFVIVDAETGRVALAVDALLGQEEVVLKGLTPPLDMLPGLAGVTILGSGRPIFILDTARLFST